MLLVHLVLSIVPETRCWRISELQEENVVEHHHAWTINKTQSVDPHLTAAVDGRFVGNRGKQSLWDVVENSLVSRSSSMETPGGHEHILQSSGARNSETALQKAYVDIFFLVLWCRFTLCWFDRAFFDRSVYDCSSLFCRYVPVKVVTWLARRWQQREEVIEMPMLPPIL
jgi:hypothetical protein